MRIYQYITYLPKTKLFDLRDSIKVDLEDIHLSIDLVNEYLAIIKKVTLPYQIACQHTIYWQFDISALPLKDVLKPYIYLLYTDNLDFPPYYCKKELEAQRYADIKFQKSGLVCKILPLYRNPFNTKKTP